MSSQAGGRIAVAGLACVAAVALASAVLGLRDVFHDLHAADDAYGSMSAYDAEHFGATSNGIDPAALDLYRENVGKNDRYYLLVGPDAAFQDPNGAEALPFYVRYWLAPARQVDNPTKATIVLTYAADPHALPLRYARVESLAANTGHAVAWVAA